MGMRLPMPRCVYTYIYYEISRTTREHGGHCATAARRSGSSHVRKCLSTERKESKRRAKVGNKIELLSLLSTTLRKPGRARSRGPRVHSLSYYVHPRTLCTAVYRLSNPAENVQDRTACISVMLALILPSVRKYGAVVRGRETERRMNLLIELSAPTVYVLFEVIERSSLLE